MLPILSKIMESIVSEQMKLYLSFVTDFQHAYREGHSTVDTLTQMTDDWLTEIWRKEKKS